MSKAQDQAPILQIAPVKRESAKVFIALAGTTGSGKTYSALLLALGLAGGDPKKIGFLDTENRRGSLYADIFETPFLHADFQPPFSPTRYIAAMKQFAEQDIEVLVIDSGSHEHEGQGGLEEIANAPNSRGEERKVADWITAKREHRKFMNTMLHLPCHVIVCFRAREKTSFKDPKKPVSMGFQPICEKNVMFEATASFMMDDAGKTHDVIKLPKCLEPIFATDGYFTSDIGAKLRKWLGNPDSDERAKNMLRLAASSGMDALAAAWAKLTKAERAALEQFKDTLKGSAQAADEERAQEDGSATPQEEADKKRTRTRRTTEVVTPKIWSDLLPNQAWKSVRVPTGMQGENEQLSQVIIDPDLYNWFVANIGREDPAMSTLRMAIDCAIYTTKIERRATSKGLDVSAINALLIDNDAIAPGQSILTLPGEEMEMIADQFSEILK